MDNSIYLIAPAGKFDSSFLEEIVIFFQEKYGFKVTYNPDILSNDIPYHSNTDEFRLNDLKNAIKSDCKIIWCIRGGYGSAKLIQDLNKLPILKQNKIFIGFSDITALHIFFNQKWGWKTIHGPVINQFINNSIDNQSKKTIIDLLYNKYNKHIQEVLPLNNLAKNSTNIQGKLCGGNMEIIRCSIGTEWQLNTEGKILFIEEVGESLYRIDRSIYHLIDSNIINSQTKAVVLMDITPVEGDCTKDIDNLINRMSNIFPCPLFRGKNVGHELKNLPLMIGSDATINLNEKHIFCNYIDVI